MKTRKKSDFDLRDLTDRELELLLKQLRELGRGEDTILAHINPEEAAMLKEHGGSGRINPYTGLPEFDDGGGDGGGGGGDGGGRRRPALVEPLLDSSAPVHDIHVHPRPAVVQGRQLVDLLNLHVLAKRERVRRERGGV